MILIQKLKDLGGYWHYEGGRYLAKLTSGKISDTFCNTGVLTYRPDIQKVVPSKEWLQDIYRNVMFFDNLHGGTHE